ncbi:AAA family ATPase [Candidatus Saccharibacteria bacterium]|nr:AAA family ATPase [Candidatus Saccharibacteria bacterium]
MRLLSFQIKQYRSIIDTGVVKLSDHDNISVFAGQNESGKSSVLHALRDYENDTFENNSLPFSTDARPIQQVSCTYGIEPSDNLATKLRSALVKNFKLTISDDEGLIDAPKINGIKQFTITKTKDGEKTSTEIDESTFNIFCNAVSEIAVLPATSEIEETVVEPLVNQIVVAPLVDEAVADAVKNLPISEMENDQVANIFWTCAPKIIFFDDFCDLLPDRMYISDLKAEKKEAEGYTAVRNLEKILKTNFVDKDAEDNAVRDVKESSENKTISIDFQNDWAQRIHGENEVVIKYKYRKLDEGSPKGSYIQFYVETREGQPLPPKQRSKGLIWFLSLWLELKAQDIDNDNLILLLDEPDQHLHVCAQRDILQLINKLSKSKDDRVGNQIIYSTHSPYLIEVEHLSRIKLVLNTEIEGTRAEDIVASVINTEYKKDALQPIAYAIGLSVGEFSMLSKRNVLLEGVSDFYYFCAMKKVLKRVGDYQFVPGVGLRKIDNLISLCIGYGLEWLAIIDDDPAFGGKDSKKKFDEIKDHVFDGDAKRTKEKVHILHNVVGVENMFTISDLKLVDKNLGKDVDMVKVVGRKRKVLFSKLFFEMIEHDKDGTLAEKISKKAKDNFSKAFDYIERNLP